jgi:hypothetical protein
VDSRHLTRFIGIPGHEPRTICFLDKDGRETTSDGEVAEVVVELTRKGRGFRCVWGRAFSHCYDCRERLVRDLPWGPWHRVFLLVPSFRVECPDCGVKTEPLEWVRRKTRHTARLLDAVALACREVRSIQAIAESFGLGWDLVKEVDKRLGDYRYPAAARKWFDGWYQRAVRSRVRLLGRFARALRERVEGVLARCRFPIHTGTLSSRCGRHGQTSLSVAPSVRLGRAVGATSRPVWAYFGNDFPQQELLRGAAGGWATVRPGGTRWRGPRRR